MSPQLRTLLVHAGQELPTDLRKEFSGTTRQDAVRIDRFSQLRDWPFDLVVFDLDNVPVEIIKDIAQWRGTVTGQTLSTIFVVDSQSRSQLLAQGAARGANMIRRPFDEQDILGLLKHLSQSIEDKASGWAKAKQAENYHRRFPAFSEALVSCDSILDTIFGATSGSGTLDTRDIAERSGVVIESLQAAGLPAWIEAVRSHHDMTYQHCLLVTGTLLAFGQHLTMRSADMERLAVGGLLHDLGKADIPLSILDKPAALTPEELSIMRLHPLTGLKRLEGMSGTTPSLVSFVRDHHEYLDGSGYPNGLIAENIGDPVRLLTIADIFSALMERRAYKPEMKAEDAYQLMTTMEGKVDQGILAGVKPVLLAMAH